MIRVCTYTTVPIGVINTALLGCKTHRISTVVYTATGGEFTPYSGVYRLFTGSFLVQIWSTLIFWLSTMTMTMTIEAIDDKKTKRVASNDKGD